MPEYTWIASGGSEMLSMERLSELKRLDMVLPITGSLKKWEHKTRHFNREMDVTVDQAVQAGTLPDGADILDLMLKDAEKEMNYETMKKDNDKVEKVEKVEKVQKEDTDQPTGPTAGNKEVARSKPHRASTGMNIDLVKLREVMVWDKYKGETGGAGVHPETARTSTTCRSIRRSSTSFMRVGCKSGLKRYGCHHKKSCTAG